MYDEEKLRAELNHREVFPLLASMMTEVHTNAQRAVWALRILTVVLDIAPSLIPHADHYNCIDGVVRFIKYFFCNSLSLSLDTFIHCHSNYENTC